jgi:uncharacterized damage-inducible protein DinB
VSQVEEPRSGAGVSMLFAGYLDFFRETVIRKTASLPAEEQRHTRLPTGWTPLGMLSHLAHMERRWFLWGFAGEDVADPWGDSGDDDQWQVPEGWGLDELAGMLRDVGRRTTELLRLHDLTEAAPPGPRFKDEPDTLAWICFHVFHEYARHAGHLDVAVELAGGELGE